MYIHIKAGQSIRREVLELQIMLGQHQGSLNLITLQKEALRPWSLPA